MDKRTTKAENMRDMKVTKRKGRGVASRTKRLHFDINTLIKFANRR